LEEEGKHDDAETLEFQVINFSRFFENRSFNVAPFASALECLADHQRQLV
jgi:hypothetical protein